MSKRETVRDAITSGKRVDEDEGEDFSSVSAS